MLSAHVLFTLIQARTYVQWKLASGGTHESGLLSLLERFTPAATDHSWGPEMSLANSSRLAVVHDAAPDCERRVSLVEANSGMKSAYNPCVLKRDHVVNI